MISALQPSRFAPLAGALLLGSLAVAGLSAATGGGVRPLLLWNRTASEPEGLYVRDRRPVAVGALIAFPAPATAFPYADARMGYLRRTPILKAVAAGAGDHVCTAGDILKINGRALGPVYHQDRTGRTLPRWQGCRRLGENELFVFSARIPNSFDSRYFGPVSRDRIVGVFRPLARPITPPGDR